MQRAVTRLLAPPALALSLACSVNDPGLAPGAPAKVEEAADKSTNIQQANMHEQQAAAAIVAKTQQFAPAELSADLSALPESERATLDKLIAAARLMDPILDRQSWAGTSTLHAKLRGDGTPLGRASLAYFEIMRGPWDRQDHNKPFAIDKPRPPGAGFYLSLIHI